MSYVDDDLVVLFRDAPDAIPISVGGVTVYGLFGSSDQDLTDGTGRVLQGDQTLRLATVDAAGIVVLSSLVTVRGTSYKVVQKRQENDGLETVLILSPAT